MYLYGIEISQNGMKAKKLGSLNCTFMKLKSHNLFIASNLITCLNCTFMELKYDIDARPTPEDEGLNCTFMELK